MNIVLTASALEHMRRATSSGATVRLALTRSGCAGVRYQLDLGEAQPGDLALSFVGFTLFVAGEDAELLDGTVIDAVEDLTGRRITFTNPRETARCGCGQSVALCA